MIEVNLNAQFILTREIGKDMITGGEGKVMGLAPYGQPTYATQIRDNLIDLKDDGSFRLNLRYFDYCAGLTMTSEAFHRLFNGPPRDPHEPLDQRHMDLAASVQAVLEDVVLAIVRDLRRSTGVSNLCLAGGVALNCVANGRVLRESGFERVWIQPASGDAGGSLGAALAASHLALGAERDPKALDGMGGTFLGPAYGPTEVEDALTEAGANFKVMPDDATLVDVVADALGREMAVGWFQGRMEFGPRALGNRSILADPRTPDMQKTLNLKIKFRESFRPFAPAVLREDLEDWFDLTVDSPYMLLVSEVSAARRAELSQHDGDRVGLDQVNAVRSEIPAVTHVDDSARIQTVHPETNPLFHQLISAFKRRTGCPVLVNTSFNVRGEPIVASPRDAFRCFMGTGLDVLAVGRCVMYKTEQNPDLSLDYKSSFDPD